MLVTFTVMGVGSFFVKRHIDANPQAMTHLKQILKDSLKKMDFLKKLNFINRFRK